MTQVGTSSELHCSERRTTVGSGLLSGFVSPGGWRLWGFCLLLSASLLAIGTRSSPLYPTNDWVDANAFFTVARGMARGLVPYRDLFEQKGPLVYALHALASLLFDKTFLGVYLLEVISLTTYLVLMWKTVVLWSDRRPLRFALLPVLMIPVAFLAVNSHAFTLGDSAEEWCLPLMAGGIYLLSLRLRRSKDPGVAKGMAGYGGLLLTGMLAGCVLWIKFTLLGFWLGWILSVLFDLRGRSLREKGAAAGLFAAGMMVSTLPWLVYFGAHHAVVEWLEVYFWVNLRYYPSRFSFWTRPFVAVGLFAYMSFRNLPLFLAFCVGLWPVSRKAFGQRRTTRGVEQGPDPERDGMRRILQAVLLCLGFQILGSYGGGHAYSYYYLVFAPFVVVGIVAVRSHAERCLSRWAVPEDDRTASSDRHIANWRYRAAGLLLFALAVSLTALYHPNAEAMTLQRGGRVQDRFAAIIKAEENPSLLNYGYLDHGFYLAAELVPGVRFFENQNIPRTAYPTILDEQERYIAEKRVGFVVVRRERDAAGVDGLPDVLLHNYRLVATGHQEYRHVIYRYDLYQVAGEG